MTGEYDVSDLVGELQELQSATNTSTAADLLKQGAGRTQTFAEGLSHTLYADIALLTFHQQRLLEHHIFHLTVPKENVYVNLYLLISLINKLVMCCI